MRLYRKMLEKYFIESLNELGFRVILLDKSILGYNSNIMMIEELKNEIEGLKMKLSRRPNTIVSSCVLH